MEMDATMRTASIGLFFWARTALAMAKVVAKDKGYSKTKMKHTWGDEDGYGLLRGVYIIKREVHE